MFPIRDINPHKSFPIVVVGLIIVNILIFIYENMISTEFQVIAFFNAYGFVPATAMSNYWSCITAIFLHGSWMHLLGNLWFLWLFGDNVEDEMGHGRFLVFYIFCGILANFAHYLSDPSSVLPVVGASGAIAGVMGAYLLLFKHSRILTFVPPFFFFRFPARFFLVFWLVAQITSGAMLAYGTAEDGVAFWAHVGGFVAGMLLYRLFLQEKDWIKEQRF